MAIDFLADFKALKLTVPRAALFNTHSENSAYTQYSISNRNVYVCFGCEKNEDCYYGLWIYDNKNVVDCAYVYETEIAYECVDVRRSYNIYFSRECSDCRDLFLCFDCIGSADCFGCAGLRRGEYQIFNVKYSWEEYFKRLAELRDEWKTAEGRAEILAKFETLKATVPHVYMNQLENENCTGNHIYNCRNCQWSFDARRCEDGQYLYNTFDLKNCSDCSYVKEGELLYECLSCFGTNFNFCYVCWGGANLDFCELCFNCQDCLGCIGLNKKRFCILNVQYSEEEYREKSAKIKGELREKGLYSGRLPEVFWES